MMLCGVLSCCAKVGGVPEVMPSQMIKYAPPDPKELTRVLARAIVKDVKDVVPHEFHDNVRRMYSWRDVALRTIKVYPKQTRLTIEIRISRLWASELRKDERHIPRMPSCMSRGV